MEETPLIILTKHARERTLHRFSRRILATVDNVTCDFKYALEHSTPYTTKTGHQRIDGNVFTFVYVKDRHKFIIITFLTKRYKEVE